jgi:hypothetical protein
MYEGEQLYMKDFGWKTQRKRLLGSPRCRWEDNVITGLKEIEREGVEWSGLFGSGEGKVVYYYGHSNEP